MNHLDLVTIFSASHTAISYFEHPAPQFCEAQLCEGIVQPANAWSSLVYCFVGIWLCSNRVSQETPFSKFFSAIAVLIGIASFAYHAFYVVLTQFLDLVSMFLFSNLILTLNLSRAGIIAKKAQTLFWLSSVLIAAISLLFSLQLGRTIFGISIGLTLMVELYLYSKDKQTEYRSLLVALFLFLIALIIWGLDLYRIGCDPNNHLIQGHALWHVLTAVCLIFVDRFYRNCQHN